MPPQTTTTLQMSLYTYCPYYIVSSQRTVPICGSLLPAVEFRGRSTTPCHNLCLNGTATKEMELGVELLLIEYWCLHTCVRMEPRCCFPLIFYTVFFLLWCPPSCQILFMVDINPNSFFPLYCLLRVRSSARWPNLL
jgi:hypothetical protein